MYDKNKKKKKKKKNTICSHIFIGSKNEERKNLFFMFTLSYIKIDRF